MYGLVGTVSGMAVIWTITAINIERSWVLYCVTLGRQCRCHEMPCLVTQSCKSLVTRSNIGVIKVVVSGIWVLALVAGLVPLTGWNQYIYEVTTCSRQNQFPAESLVTTLAILCHDVTQPHVCLCLCCTIVLSVVQPSCCNKRK